jgi:hypothetical protein
MMIVCGILAVGVHAQPSAGRQVGLAMGLQLSYGGSKTNVVAAADKMPEAGVAATTLQIPRTT